MFEERILLSNNINEATFLRTLARFNVNTINYRIMNFLDYANQVITSSGDYNCYNLISIEDEVSILFSLLKDIPYFKNCKYEDAIMINNTLFTMRLLITDDNERKCLFENLSKSKFIDKNKAIISLYNKYINYLLNNNLVDRISLFRIAINKNYKLNTNVYILEEDNVEPLFLKLALCSKRLEKINYLKLFYVLEKKVNITKFYKCYGEINEINNAIDYIYENKIPFDECVIVGTDGNKYSMILNELKDLYQFSFTNGNGVRIVDTNPGKLLKLIYDWDTTKYHNIDSLRNIIYSDAFNYNKFVSNLGLDNIDELIDIIGNLKLSFDKKSNDYKCSRVLEMINRRNETSPIKKDDFDNVLKICNEFNQGLLYFINEYYKDTNDNSNNLSALNKINNIVNSLNKYGYNNINDIVNYLLGLCVNQENSKPERIEFVSINKLLSGIRKNVFFVGLDLGSLIGVPKENNILLDEDYNNLSVDYNAYTSTSIVLNKKNNFINLIKLLSSLDCNIVLSYSCYSLSDLKDNNPESVLFDAYCLMNGDDKTIDDFDKDLEYIGFFNDGLNINNGIARKYLSNVNINNVINEKKEFDYNIKHKTVSPTAIEVFLDCPRKFFMMYFAGLKNIDTDNPFDIIKANDLGNLVHEVFEEYGNDKSKWNKDSLSENALNKFDDFIITRPCEDNDLLNKTRYQYKEMIENGFEINKEFDYIKTEESVYYNYSDVLRIGGRFDALVRNHECKYFIIDYKTKLRLEHEEDDPVSCIQALLYAYILEHQKEKIVCDKVYYEYLRFPNKYVSCDYNDEARAFIEELLERLDDYIRNANYPCDSNDCNYCPFKGFCGKIEESDGSQDANN